MYDDKLVLTYNYQHGTQTITLKEVEDFLGSDLVGLSPPKKHDGFVPKPSCFFCFEKGSCVWLMGLYWLRPWGIPRHTWRFIRNTRYCLDFFLASPGENTTSYV